MILAISNKNKEQYCTLVHCLLYLMNQNETNNIPVMH